ncbi:FtsX-like permease family protein [Tissierella sp.]|uniref:FtsX-like permease family protein n=1 Tax=Tissierella sp. TaxID=41274 RepID=UPI00285D1731|nr:FtsX-like permease family protein [Tissierella sp.]MDR7855981.1 FtsX-like permease family protein [Tissierella sp.]
MEINALSKDIVRDIKKSLGRFLSIAAIIALGVAFFSGLKIAPEDMKFTADKYYDDYNLMDIRILSTLGLTEKDLDEISKIEGIKETFATYTIDALARFNDAEAVLRVHGIASDNIVNRVRLVKGRLPEKPNECVIEEGKNGSISVPLGSTIQLSSGKDELLSESLKNTGYKVVGTVQTPYYLSFEKGSSNIGNGQVRNFIMIPQENFKLEVYTDIFATVDGATELNSYKDEYFHIVDNVTDELKNLAKDREIIRHKEILSEGRAEIEKGKNEYLEEKVKVEEKLSDVLRDIEDAKIDIASGEMKLSGEEKEFNVKIQDGKEKIANAEKDLSAGEIEYENGLKAFSEQKAIAEENFKNAENEIEKGEEGLLKLEESISQINSALENPLLADEQRQKINSDLQTAIAMLEGTKKSVEDGKRQLEAGRFELNKGEEELNNAKELLLSSRKALEEEKVKLIEGEETGIAEFKKARRDIEEAKIKLLDGEKEYLEGKNKADKELADAWKKIEDGERKLSKVEKGKWYVLDRDSHYSYVDYGGAADRIDALSKVFPIFFALVAALVCLTTMTRMVDEQRVNIGTLKALGYSKGSIASKYIIYALTATVLGCIIGIGVGYTLFPTVIFNAYGIMYILPPVTLNFNIGLATAISLGAIGLITMTTFLACNNELKESPSSLMRPRAPKMGKRILLERIPFIWNRFSFSYKVTTRNIFRYKRRFFMTVIGIAGCTALMLTAFGIKDSIRTVVDRQYGVLFTYDMTVGIKPSKAKYLDEVDKINSYELILRESGTLSSNNIKKDISIVVPKDIKNIDSFIHLQERKKENKINIPEEGIVITEQVGKSLDVKVGDEITFINVDNDEALVKIIGITENYTFNYVYLSANYYEEIFDKEVEFNEAIAILEDTSKDIEDQLSTELLSLEGISGVNFNRTVKEDFENTIRSLNYVVMVMIISAGALAFVVLYNLTNVNISERIREIATIKVLGFYDSEVSAYIYRENTILTIIGTMVGLVMGVILHRFIMITVEMDNIMFGLKLSFKSHIISIILTLVFAILVNFAMYYKLKNVEMVESLKSVD